DYGDSLRPFNAKRRVIVAYSRRRGRLVEGGDKIRDEGVVGQGLEPMRASRWNVELALVRRAQLEGLPFSEAVRLGTQVDNDVVDRARNAADDFYFRMRRLLIVHATQGSGPRGERAAVLHELCFESAFREDSFAKRAHKVTAL